MRHWIDAASKTVRHRTRLTTKRRPVIDRVIVYLRRHKPSDDGHMQERGSDDRSVSEFASGQLPHPVGCPRSIVLRPPLVGIGFKDVDSPRSASNLALKRYGSASFPFANFQAKQFIVPPGDFCCVRMNATPGRSDQAGTTKQQQISVAYLRGGFCKGNQSLSQHAHVNPFQIADFGMRNLVEAKMSRTPSAKKKTQHRIDGLYWVRSDTPGKRWPPKGFSSIPLCYASCSDFLATTSPTITCHVADSTTIFGHPGESDSDATSLCFSDSDAANVRAS